MLIDALWLSVSVTCGLVEFTMQSEKELLFQLVSFIGIIEMLQHYYRIAVKKQNET